MKRPLDPLTADTRPFNTAILPSLAFLILVSFLFSCSKTSLPDQDGFVQYTIPAGEHYSLENGLKKVEGKVMRFEVKFNQSAAYTTQKPENQFDINKLYGFSDCGAQHHVNSARVGAGVGMGRKLNYLPIVMPIRSTNLSCWVK